MKPRGPAKCLSGNHFRLAPPPIFFPLNGFFPFLSYGLYYHPFVFSRRRYPLLSRRADLIFWFFLIISFGRYAEEKLSLTRRICPPLDPFFLQLFSLSVDRRPPFTTLMLCLAGISLVAVGFPRIWSPMFFNSISSPTIHQFVSKRHFAPSSCLLLHLFVSFVLLQPRR